MGRPAYKIKKSDFWTAYHYIKNAMNREDISRVDGYTAFRSADTPELLQAWCDDYMNSEQWKNLKNSIWVSRKRAKDYKTSKQKKQVDLDLYAWQRLKDRAEENDLSLSEMILKMDEVMNRAGDAGIKC